MKVKFSRYRPGVAQKVGRSIALLIHDRGTTRGRAVSSTPRPHFTPGKDPVPILLEAGWAPGKVRTGGKSRPDRDSIPDRPARSSVAIPTELPGPQNTWRYAVANRSNWTVTPCTKAKWFLPPDQYPPRMTACLVSAKTESFTANFSSHGNSCIYISNYGTSVVVYLCALFS